MCGVTCLMKNHFWSFSSSFHFDGFFLKNIQKINHTVRDKNDWQELRKDSASMYFICRLQRIVVSNSLGDIRFTKLCKVEYDCMTILSMLEIKIWIIRVWSLTLKATSEKQKSSQPKNLLTKPFWLNLDPSFFIAILAKKIKKIALVFKKMV